MRLFFVTFFVLPFFVTVFVLPFLCFVVTGFQDGGGVFHSTGSGGSSSNYRGSVDIKAELGRTQSKARVILIVLRLRIL